MYVGRGSHDRAIRVNGRSIFWYTTLTEHLDLIEVEVATGYLSLREAEKEEKKYIQLYKDTCINLQHNGDLGVPVMSFTRDGNLVKEYDYLSAVVEDGFAPGCVSGCCQGNRGLHKNLVWMFRKDYLKTGFQHKYAANHSKMIEQIDDKGVVVRSLLTAQAFSVFGFDPKNIQQVCTGSKKSHAGFVFRYISK